MSALRDFIRKPVGTAGMLLFFVVAELVYWMGFSLGSGPLKIVGASILTLFFLKMIVKRDELDRES